MTKRWIAAAGLLLFLAVPVLTQKGWAQNPPADLVLTGDVTGAQHQTYFEVPFAVPAGTHRISVDFEYTGKEERATLDLGIADPERFRGESGGNKSHFTIAETDATPSYLPGAIPAGLWHLIVAVPNMRPKAVSHYRAEVRFNSRQEDSSFAAAPLALGTRWYRGDLHMHTAHSDGSCASQTGKTVPCPVFVYAQTATARGLDFIAITDHNADSQNQAMRELQPYFDHLLLIPGREMTTFHGHFNIFGVTQFVDWRVTPGGLDLNTVLRDVRAKGGIASVSHAESPEGEFCMGCRWTHQDADMSLFTAIEAINGGRFMFSSTRFWDAQLRQGFRLAAVGGSDSHNGSNPPGPPGSVGWPTTAVEAKDLSVSAILDGIRAGRTFIDLTASRNKVVDFTAESGSAHARMGETLHTAGPASLRVEVRTAGCAGSVVHLLVDSAEGSAAPMAVDDASDAVGFALRVDAGRHWLRVEIRDAKGSLQLVSSPLYLNFPG